MINILAGQLGRLKSDNRSPWSISWQQSCCKIALTGFQNSLSTVQHTWAFVYFSGPILVSSTLVFIHTEDDAVMADSACRFTHSSNSNHVWVVNFFGVTYRVRLDWHGLTCEAIHCLFWMQSYFLLCSLHTRWTWLTAYSPPLRVVRIGGARGRLLGVVSLQENGLWTHSLLQLWLQLRVCMDYTMAETISNF